MGIGYLKVAKENLVPPPTQTYSLALLGSNHAVFDITVIKKYQFFNALELPWQTKTYLFRITRRCYEEVTSRTLSLSLPFSLSLSLSLSLLPTRSLSSSLSLSLSLPLSPSFSLSLSHSFSADPVMTVEMCSIGSPLLGMAVFFPNPSQSLSPSGGIKTADGNGLRFYTSSILVSQIQDLKKNVK